MNIELKPKHFVITGAAIVSLGYGVSQMFDTLIHNSQGIDFADDFQFTWQVQVSAASDCGGVIVAKEWVLTAAHCLKNKEEEIEDAAEIKVLAGTREIEGKTGKSALAFKIHESFDMDKSPMQYDIALIKVSMPSASTSVIRLASVDQPLPDTMFVAGWNCDPSDYGSINALIRSYSDCGNRLGYTDVQPFAQDECTTRYGDRFVCAGGSASRKPPLPGFDQEDSGGGLVTSTRQNPMLIGIANYILTEWEAYARVTAYSKWIQDVICVGTVPGQEPNCPESAEPTATVPVPAKTENSFPALASLNPSAPR